jgi:hypothetical protein
MVNINKSGNTYSNLIHNKASDLYSDREKSFEEKRKELSEKDHKNIYLENIDKYMKSKEAEEALSKEIKASKRKNIETMIKTFQMLPLRNYTQDSWKRAMTDVERAVSIYKSKNATHSQLNKALGHLITAMSKLKPAQKEEAKGNPADSMKAMHEMNKDLFEKNTLKNNVEVPIPAPSLPDDTAPPVIDDISGNIF